MHNLIIFPVDPQPIHKYHIYYMYEDMEIRMYGIYFTTIELANDYCNKLNKRDKTTHYYTR